jgi:hypothetical protein
MVLPSINTQSVTTMFGSLQAAVGAAATAPAGGLAQPPAGRMCTPAAEGLPPG